MFVGLVEFKRARQEFGGCSFSRCRLRTMPPRERKSQLLALLLSLSASCTVLALDQAPSVDQVLRPQLFCRSSLLCLRFEAKQCLIQLFGTLIPPDTEREAANGAHSKAISRPLHEHQHTTQYMPQCFLVHVSSEECCCRAAVSAETSGASSGSTA